MYALVSNIHNDTRAIVSSDGQRFEFPAGDGGLITDMLADEFPECESCASRWEICVDCHGCRDCGICDCDVRIQNDGANPQDDRNAGAESVGGNVEPDGRGR